MSFITLAQEAQKELEGEKARLKQKESKLDEKSSALAGREALIVETESTLHAKEKELQVREEEVSRREINARRDSQVQEDLHKAEALHAEAAKIHKKAEEANLDTKLKLEELATRELALLEREKTYEKEIKEKITTKMLGI